LCSAPMSSSFAPQPSPERATVHAHDLIGNHRDADALSDTAVRHRFDTEHDAHDERLILGANSTGAPDIPSGKG